MPQTYMLAHVAKFSIGHSHCEKDRDYAIFRWVGGILESVFSSFKMEKRSKDEKNNIQRKYHRISPTSHM